MNTTFTTLTDAALAGIAAGTNGATFTGFDPLPQMGPGPVLPLDAHLTPWGPRPAEEIRRFPIGPCPNPDANG